MLVLNVPHSATSPHVATRPLPSAWQEEVKERAAAALVNAIKESTAGGGPKPSLAYGSTSSRAASDSTSTQPSPSDTSPRTPNKRVPIVPAEGLDTSSDS